MNKMELQDSGESSLGLKHLPGFSLKGENTRVDKGKEVKALLNTDILNGLDFCPTTTRHDNKHHSSTIWRFFYKFSHVFEALYKAHR